MRQVDRRTREILENATVDGVRVRVVDEVTPADWAGVADVLRKLGGRYQPGSRAYVFEADPTAALGEVIASGTVDTARGAEGYVATPDVLAEQLTGYPYSAIATLPAGAWALEPSAGGGALVRAVVDANPDVQVMAIEPNTARSKLIDVDGGRVRVVNSTLESYVERAEGRRFDAVIMNPPFSVPGNRTIWIDHVRLAWDLLRPGGRLAAVVPAGFTFRSDRKTAGIRDLVERHGAYEKLPRTMFDGIAGVIWLAKPMPTHVDRPPYLVSEHHRNIQPLRVSSPLLSPKAALTAPVQVMHDGWAGRDRVLRYLAQCAVCGWLLWSFDDRDNSPLGMLRNHAGCDVLDADEEGLVGPSVGLCFACANTSKNDEAARILARKHWTDPEPADAGDEEPAGECAADVADPWAQLLTAA